MPLLERIQHPDDLKGLTPAELEQLADELRTMIIRTVASNGGHLASNLGLVELTIALLLEFDFTKDRIVFDVGHQSYAYKILTGRRDRFSTLRQEKGISGFPKREESPFDSFNTGHSSTSISAALGMVRGLALQGKPGQVIALIGDGALSGGMALEAMNDAGQFNENLIIILNDNQMSISPNVGSLSKHLENLRLSPRYNRVKSRVELQLQKIPLFGNPLVGVLQAGKKALRLLIRSEAVFFESMGFRYYGPVDGHHLTDLRAHLHTIRAMKGPIVLHVMTQKGKGYDFAEEAPDLYHGVAPFVIENGICPGPEVCPPSFSDVFGETLIRLAEQNPKLVALTAAMPTGTGLSRFASIYPGRFHDCGIAEQHTVTMAAGMASIGLMPVVAMYATFLQRATDQILHDICLQNLPVVLAVDRAGIVGEDGETHQGIYDLAHLAAMPNMTLLAPRDNRELSTMLTWAVQAERPVAIRYPRGREAAFPELASLTPVPEGHAQILLEGEDATIISVGTCARAALDAASILSDEQIRVEVIDLRWAKPIDWASVESSVLKTGRLLVVEEGTIAGGIGSVILEHVFEMSVPVKAVRAALADTVHHQARRDAVLRQQGLDGPGLADRLRQMMELSS